jgi:hypothetical protein
MYQKEKGKKYVKRLPTTSNSPNQSEGLSLTSHPKRRNWLYLRKS